MASKKLQLKEAKENYSWVIIPIHELPDGVPVIGISEYPSKIFAEHNLIDEVIVPYNFIRKSKTAQATDTCK